MNRIIKDEYGNSGFESQTQLFDEFQQKVIESKSLFKIKN